MNKLRLDKLLLIRKITYSREKAAKLIKEGKIEVNGALVTKSSKEFEEDCEIKLSEDHKEYVGRGALKLLHAIKTWDIDVEGLFCADFGASTGGFTEVLLENGAKKVYAVDVGHSQLHESLRRDERVINMEGVNLKEQKKAFLSEKIDAVVCDLSFISILKIIDAIKTNLKPGGFAVILVKPQFELSKEDLNREGVVKSEEKRKLALENVIQALEKIGFSEIKTMKSPIKGGDGNIEYLLYAKMLDY